MYIKKEMAKATKNKNSLIPFYIGGRKMSKEIVLKSLALKNFKGVKNLHIDFGKVTEIYGENATGKTTVFDAFTWTLFDKDSKDRSKFNVQPLDESNNVIHMVDTEATAVLEIDRRPVELKKILKEKWVKKRGEAESELKGTETLYYVDEVPVKLGEYKNKINETIDENIFKLVTNPLYFSVNMKWQDRRKVLLDIIGDVTTERVIVHRSDLKALEAMLMDKDIDALKKSLSVRRRKLNDDIRAIPFRIDECNNSIKQLDFESLELQKMNVVSSIKSVEDRILDSSKVNEGLLEEKNRFYMLKSKLKNIEFRAKEAAQKPLHELRVKVYELNNQASTCKINIRSLENDLAYDEKQASTLDNELQSLREEYGKINTETLEIPEESFICPTCNRPLEEHDIETQKHSMVENFNLNKAKKLANINTQGKAKKDRLLRHNESIAKLKEELEREKLQLNSFEAGILECNNKIDNFDIAFNLEDNQEYQNTLKQIQELEQKLKQPSDTSNSTTELRIKKRELEGELEDINRQLAYKQHNENMKARIEELQQDEKRLAQQIAELEGQEFMCEEFIKTKVELLESSINSKFKYVTFKLFESLVNGGLVDTCEALIDGVPFSNANTASQINAGMDIINALCGYYGVQAPIFIDNRESINEILDTNSQIINLIVSNDKQLKVEVI